MTGITQQIPFYIHGISEQPDELKKPGQLRDAKNVIPDVITGLSKRAGARLVNPLGFNEDGSGTGSVKQGTWFSIYRDEKEQYIGHINKTGAVEIWDCFSGMPHIVQYSDRPIPTKYPNSPDNPDNLGRPANDSCDVTSFGQTQNTLRNYTYKKEEIQVMIDKTQSGIDFLLGAGGNAVETFIEYTEQGGGRVVLGQGYVVGCKYDNEDDDYNWDTCQKLTAEVNKPEGAVLGVPIKTNIKQVQTQDQDRDANAHEAGWYNATIYDWKIPATVGGDGQTLAELEEQLAMQKAQLAELEEEEGVARIAYGTQAQQCGVYGEPNSVGEYNNRVISSENLTTYLQHEEQDDLQVLTVNDYTFVNNRLIETSMSKAEVNNRPYEGFIDLRQIAYNKQYAVNIWSPENDTEEVTSHAASLTLTAQQWDRDENGCPNIGTEIFDVDQGDAKNLRFEISTTGQSILRDQKKPDLGYRCYYNSSVNLIFGGENWEKGDIVEVTMKERTYKVVVDEVSTTSAMLGSQVRPDPTPSDGSTVVKAEDILNDLADAIEENNAVWKTEIVGNGIYISSDFPFLLETPEGQLMNIITDSANNIAKLPSQCKDGYQVRVANSSNDEDDYYVQFETKYGSVSGEGVWKEIAHPGIETTFNWSSMPHQIVRQGDGTFLVSPIDWDLRKAGDNITNPIPSFVGKAINKMLFFRNRLAILSDENIVLSRPGDFFNFFGVTALKVVANDPIDVAVASTYPATLFDGIEVNAGLLLFSPNQQFLLTTDNDLLSPETVKVNGISSYRYNTFTRPISMGPTVGFVNDAGARTRFFEMTNIKREGEVEVIEQSKLISKSIPSGINQLAESKENSIVFLGKQGTREIWVYKYFQDGQKRIQSAWVKWELTGELVYHAVLGDTYYMVVGNTFENVDTAGQEVLTMQRVDLKETSWSAIVEDGEGYEYTVHMDNYRVVWPTDLQYYKHLDQTYFRLPLGYFSDKQLAAYTLKYGKFQGRAIYPQVVLDNLGTWCVLEGNWENTRMMLGYEFEMSVEFPTMYMQKKTQTGMISDTRGSLVIHRANLDLGPSGVYETTLKRKGRADYTLLYETRPEDEYKADEVMFVPELIQTVPIYDRNTNVTLELKSSHPSPATLYSMNWEGDYNPRYYKSV